MGRRRAGPRVLVGLTVLILLAGCGSSASPTPAAGGAATSASPSPSPTPTQASGGSTTVPTPTPTPTATATLIAAIGTPADDGARIVNVTTLDARTRDLTIDSPAVGTVMVRLLIPSGFDAKPSTRFPVLYLLHGANQSHGDWTDNTDVEALTAPTDLLVVMPDAGSLGYYSDWWNGGREGRRSGRRST